MRPRTGLSRSGASPLGAPRGLTEATSGPIIGLRGEPNGSSVGSIPTIAKSSSSLTSMGSWTTTATRAVDFLNGSKLLLVGVPAGFTAEKVRPIGVADEIGSLFGDKHSADRILDHLGRLAGRID